MVILTIRLTRKKLMMTTSTDYIEAIESMHREEAEKTHIERMSKIGRKVDERSYWHPWNHGIKTWDNLNVDKVLAQDSIKNHQPTGFLSNGYENRSYQEVGCSITRIELNHSNLLDVFNRNDTDYKDQPGRYMPSPFGFPRMLDTGDLEIKNEHIYTFTRIYNIELVVPKLKYRREGEKVKKDALYDDLEYNQLVSNYISRSYGDSISHLEFRNKNRSKLEIGGPGNPVYKVSKNKDIYNGVNFSLCDFNNTSLNLYYPYFYGSYFKDCDLHIYYSKHSDNAKSYDYNYYLFDGCHLTNCNIYFHDIDRIWDLKEVSYPSWPVICNSKFKNCKIVSDKKNPKVNFSRCTLANSIIEVPKPKFENTSHNQGDIYPSYSLNKDQLNEVIDLMKFTWNAY